MTGIILLLAAFAVYAAVAVRLDRFSISAPMVFVLVGLVLGPEVTDLLNLSADSETVLTLTEVTLAVLLFCDATTVPGRSAERDAGLPGRLLGIGLLLTIAAGTVLGMFVIPEFGWAGAALIATILAPTDAALGMAVVTDKAVPVRIRRALNIESGLNDGIATPFVTLFLAAFLSEEGDESGSWILDSLTEIGLALVVALVVGLVGGRLLKFAAERGWTSHTSEQLYALALAVASYAVALEVGGNGFVAAFSAGLIFGVSAAKHREAVVFAEDASLYASFLVWVVFGGWFVGPVIAGSFDATAVIYAVVSLTLVRMVPVAIALMGKGFQRSTIAFMGWFGPRGLASVVFTLTVLGAFEGTDVDLPVLEIATWTILLSVLLHGVTARPLAAAYGRRITTQDASAPELVDAPEPRVRRHVLHRSDPAATD